MTDTPQYSGPAAIAARIITAWALLGGIVLLAVVCMNTWTVIGANFGIPPDAAETGMIADLRRWIAGIIPGPFPGDFEMTEVGICIAAFSFLPYCQLTGANVSADIFTARASPRWIGFFQTLASVVALFFAALLLWRMYAGLLDQKEYGYTTAILQFPHWIAFVPILVSLGLLAMAAVISLCDSLRQLSRGSA